MTEIANWPEYGRRCAVEAPIGDFVSLVSYLYLDGGVPRAAPALHAQQTELFGGAVMQ